MELDMNCCIEQGKKSNFWPLNWRKATKIFKEKGLLLMMQNFIKLRPEKLNWEEMQDWNVILKIDADYSKEDIYYLEET